MPATSKAQRRLMAIAEHNPTKLFAKNKGVLKMKSKLHEYASTKETKLPDKLKKLSKKRKAKKAKY